ncbi:adenylate/guanylate cyclase domain-containing protein [Aldersonia sp. NBC_00410]|uniref:adenylate/guanylate cyclase domain-containing protein n=1 Tax=Aldersonia sp. NBC_00410 TaxID=2975954 RepID=UPI00225C2D23|nr:adenylate/guanylate cyclase domain-containing protein [Aldersonia sp. NBC_00410]MCX5042709.1 adenylate/guanylate cyclase domain-containing protein [Aldersonia sp. NBC_00410]
MSADAAAAPAGAVTFLFTDVEGSTRRWETDADGMRVALAAHDKVLRAAIEKHGGRQFKHTGDGVCAAFSSPKSAVDAAVAAQRALELPVRMGMATGEAELRDGDYFGAVLNRSARVMAAGHGGQILAADSTAALLSGVDLLDLGPRRLRDVSAPVEVFQVRAPGLRTEFPALRGVDANPGNLRPAITNLIGRDSEVSDLRAALRSHRLVTLAGVGGVGKTRLALEVATQVADEFVDGVWVFELATVADPVVVPDAVAAVLGITQQPGRSVGESVASALAGRSRLLVFDNCEHVIDSVADLVAAILAASATVQVLATSREGIGVADELLWRVPSLDVVAAVKLFVERAQRVSGTPADEATVADICRRLDGIPLAIELAASRMASMTAVEVRDRLDDRFKLLVGSRRGLARHQTLRHAVAWSYDLLDDDEKFLLTRCSVFAGGFDLQSACAVVGPEGVDDYAILELLDALVRKSLLVADRPTGRTRFSMLETIRQFAEEQLVAGGEAIDVRTAHARHFAGRETEILALWDGPKQRAAYTWFATEFANLRAAFRWAADHGDLDVGAAIATCAGFLGLLVEKYEPLAWAEELIEPARALDHPRLGGLYVIASQCWMAGRVDDAVRLCDEGRDVVDGSHTALPQGLEGIFGNVYLVVGQPERTVELCRALLASDRDTSAVAEAGFSLASMLAGHPDEALAAADGLVDAAESSHNPFVLSFVLFTCGLIYREADPLRALDALRRGMTIARDSGNSFNETHLASNLARHEAEHGDPPAALGHVSLAIRNYHNSGSTTMVRIALGVLATTLDRLGRHEAAATIGAFAQSPFTALSLPEINTANAHLREVLGGRTYEALAHQGETMTTAAMVTYALDQIDQASAALSTAP